MSYNITYEDLEAIKSNAFNKEEKSLIIFYFLIELI
jgi:hypothetical protein